MDPNVASAATAAAVVPRRVCRTTGASALPVGLVTYILADEVVLGAGRLLPREGATSFLLIAAVSWLMLNDAGGAQLGHSLLHLAAVVSCTSKTCRLGGILKLRYVGSIAL